MSSEESIQQEKLSFGNQLKEARQRRGMSDIDLARKTHLGVGLIQSLEQEEASVIHRVSYVRGYIRSCAKVLEVDPAPIIDAYEQHIGRYVVEKDKVELLAMPLYPAGQKKKKIIWAVGVVTVLVLLLGYLYFESEVQLPASLSVLESYHLVDEEALLSEQVPEAVVDLVSKANIVNEDMLQTTTIEHEIAPSLPLATELEVSPSESVIGRLAEVSNNALVDVDRTNLELIIRLRCWIEIVDAQGHVLLRDVYEPLQTQKVSGVPPFDVVLGHASGIDLKVDNQNFDFSRYIRRDRSAHFTIRNPDR